jgi:hypothetical protein
VSVKNVFEEPVDVTLKITVTPEAVGLVEFEAQLKPAYGLVQVKLQILCITLHKEPLQMTCS